MPNNHCSLGMVDPIMQLDCIRFFIKSNYDKANTNRTFIMDNIEDAYDFKIGDSVKMFEFTLPEDRHKKNYYNYCVFVGNTEDIQEMYKHHKQSSESFGIYGEYLNDEGHSYRVVGILDLDMLMKRKYLARMSFPESVIGLPISIFDYYCDNSRWLYMFMNEYVIEDRNVSYDVLKKHILHNIDQDLEIDKIAAEMYSYLINRRWGKAIHMIMKYGNIDSGHFQCSGFIYDPDADEDDDDTEDDNFII